MIRPKFRGNGYKKCLLCHGEGFYEEFYFDVGDVRRRYYEVKCWPCWSFYLTENNLGFWVANRVPIGPTGVFLTLYVFFEKLDPEKKRWDKCTWKQYTSSSGDDEDKAVDRNIYWTDDQIQQFALWGLTVCSHENRQISS